MKTAVIFRRSRWTVGLFLVLTLGCSKGCNKTLPGSDTTAEPTASEAPEAQLQITDLEVGKGAEALSGKKIKVHYTGTLLDGTKFDSSIDRKQPLEFKLGASEVIKGWDDGLVGMKVGGKRELIVPPALAYGESGVENAIPPNAALKFEVELLEVKK